MRINEINGRPSKSSRVGTARAAEAMIFAISCPPTWPSASALTAPTSKRRRNNRRSSWRRGRLRTGDLAIRRGKDKWRGLRPRKRGGLIGLRFLALALGGVAISASQALAQAAAPAPASLERRRSPDHRRLLRRRRFRGPASTSTKFPPRSPRSTRKQIEQAKSPSIVKSLDAADAEHRRAGCRGQSVSARRLFPRLRRLAGFRHAAGSGGLPERHAHQRGFRRHRQLGSDPDVGRALDRRHQQQPGFRA